MSDQVLHERLEREARDLGAAVFGVADLALLRRCETDPLQRVPGAYTRAIVAGIRLQAGVLEDVVDRPTPLYFHHYRQVNNQLDRIGLRLADTLQNAGYRALPVPASQVIEREPMRAHVSHKHLAWAAGLGYRGRNNLLVHDRYGAQVRYVSVLTDLALVAGVPCEGTCGACRACVAACPAAAIQDDPAAFDLGACYAKLTEFTRLPFIGQHICGVCVKACSPEAQAVRGRVG
jgi:epoxyqueuosine reductase